MMIEGAGMDQTDRPGRRAAVAFALMAILALVAAACSFSIGRSVENRELVVQRLGSGPTIVLLIGGLHTGHEDNTRVIVEQLADHFARNPHLIPSSVTLFVLPSVNPDGTARGIHTNARGVDLNRNWPTDNWSTDACHPSSGCRKGLGGPAPLSEPETWSVYHFAQLARPEVTIVWHAEAPLVEANEVPGADTYGRTFAGASGYPYIEEWTAYHITGQLIDAFEQRLGLRAFDVELANCCTVSRDEFERNLAGLNAVLAEVHRTSRVVSPTPVPTTTRPVRTVTPGLIPGVVQ
jgi:predicted deacylase